MGIFDRFATMLVSFAFLLRLGNSLMARVALSLGPPQLEERDGA